MDLHGKVDELDNEVIELKVKVKQLEEDGKDLVRLIAFMRERLAMLEDRSIRHMPVGRDLPIGNGLPSGPCTLKSCDHEWCERMTGGAFCSKCGQRRPEPEKPWVQCGTSPRVCVHEWTMMNSQAGRDPLQTCIKCGRVTGAGSISGPHVIIGEDDGHQD